MRLFEVMDAGSIRSILAVQQGQANDADTYSQIPFVNLKSELASLGISSIDGLIALKNKVDPAGDVIKDIDSRTGMITLNTRQQDPNEPEPAPKGASPTVDKMAKSGAKKLQPDI